MKILVTGTAGFIGAAVVKALLKRGCEVVGMDNINTFYDTTLKYARLADAGIDKDSVCDGVLTASSKNASYRFIKMDLTDRAGMEKLFSTEGFDVVINLAGQAGVRYSIENPYAYVESNVLGFLNILECCRNYPVKHLIYASSSSVYGMNNNVPYSENDKTDSPVSLYAATKKSNELMAYSYSKLYGIPATGVRFFTVYGPWGRPDMAPFLFLKAALEEQPIKVFNHGKLSRDFTYIDDIVNGLMLLLESPSNDTVKHTVYNIGHSEPVELMDFIETIERGTGRKFTMEMKDMQPGDVYCTYADTSRLQNDFGYRPSVSVEEGISNFYNWYKDFYGVE